MNILAIIAEYNPFHKGHKYHLKESIKSTGASHTIALVSASFVQRGEPSLIDKWTKAEMAISNGIDLVIELPFVYSVQSAELFAYGAVEILDSLRVVNFLSFGAENNNLNLLDKISDIFLKEPDFFKLSLKNFLDKGLSFAQSRELALLEFLKEEGLYSDDFREVLNQSNNILAIEYLKALKTLNSNIQANIVSRRGAAYNDIKLKSDSFSSATSIRKSILENGQQSVAGDLPRPSYELIKDYSYNHLDNYLAEINYILNVSKFEDYIQVFDMTEDLANRFLKLNKNYNSVDSLLDQLVTKRYPRTRISRILIHLLARLTREDVVSIYSRRSNYIRILASNRKGFEIINKIKNSSDIEIINKFSDYYHIQDSNIKKILNYEVTASNLYFLHEDRKRNQDFTVSPMIRL